MRNVGLALCLALAGCTLASSTSTAGDGPAPQPPPPPPPPEASCMGSNLLGWAGKTRLLVGLAAGDPAARAAPYDLRYQYLAGPLADGAGPCASCASGCTSQGTSCANAAGGCGWWGCWQWDQVAPGAYVRDFLSRAQADGQLPMITYYLELQASGLAEGTAQLAALDDAAFLSRYLADWRFLLRQIGSAKALLHVEPDMWGYGQHRSADPAAIPARVKAAAPAECGALPDTLAGLGRCLVAMVRTHAPNARVGLHASGWASGMDCFQNRQASLDCAAEGRKVGQWLLAAGAGDGDFVGADMSDRDADWYRLVQGQQRWWDASNATLPHFHQAFTWAKAMAEALGRPVLWWQTPVGNSLQANVAGHYRDNRVEYLFAHMSEVAAAHGVGVAYGAGASGNTTPDDDGGVLAAATSAYVASGGAALCP
jgi:hypothetical protein